ncbi:MAG TPA: selenide, water dikinase SelD [Actinomycetota bacterium]
MREQVRLTRFSHGAGCACKLAPGDLTRVMSMLAPPAYPPELLVSPATGDDAAVYELPGGQGLVQTVDFFTPIVDDPFDWGRIAAANALSDVYAMGGRPLLAMNLVAWPVEDLPLELLALVLEGGAEIAREAGVTIVGGHSIRDPEPKYGMAVTGLVDPDRAIRNSTMREGDRLVLTKPLGLGLISTAIKNERASAEQVRDAVATMTRLNAAASEAMVGVGVSAATDVTGFGLIGHLHIALEGAGLAATVDAGAVPFLDGALDLARGGMAPGGTRANLRFVDPTTDWGDLPEPERLALADAQTSGGLLIAVPESALSRLVDALVERGIAPAVVGVTQRGEPGRVSITGRIRG